MLLDEAGKFIEKIKDVQIKADNLKESMKGLKSRNGKAVLKVLFTNNEMSHEHIAKLVESGMSSDKIYKILEVFEKVGIVIIARVSPALFTFKRKYWEKYLDSLNGLADIQTVRETWSGQLIGQKKDGEVVIHSPKHFQLALDSVSLLSKKTNLTLIESLLENVHKKNVDRIEAMMDKEFNKVEKFGVQSTVSRSLSKLSDYCLILRVPYQNVKYNSINPIELNKILVFIDNIDFQNKASRKVVHPRKKYLKRPPENDMDD